MDGSRFGQVVMTYIILSCGTFHDDPQGNEDQPRGNYCNVIFTLYFVLLWASARHDDATSTQYPVQHRCPSNESERKI